MECRLYLSIVDSIQPMLPSPPRMITRNFSNFWNNCSLHQRNDKTSITNNMSLKSNKKDVCGETIKIRQEEERGVEERNQSSVRK